MDVEETGRSRSKDGRFLPEIKDQTIENLQHDHSYVTGMFTMNCLSYYRGKQNSFSRNYPGKLYCPRITDRFLCYVVLTKRMRF